MKPHELGTARAQELAAERRAVRAKARERRAAENGRALEERRARERLEASARELHAATAETTKPPAGDGQGLRFARAFYRALLRDRF